MGSLFIGYISAFLPEYEIDREVYLKLTSEAGTKKLLKLNI